MNETYKCAACGGVFEQEWTEEEAQAEAVRDFPGMDTQDPNQSAMVCDDCYKAMRAAAPMPWGEPWP